MAEVKDGWTREELNDIGRRLKKELATKQASYKPPKPTEKEEQILQVAEILNIKKRGIAKWK
jgi:hypothetical protein